MLKLTFAIKTVSEKFLLRIKTLITYNQAKEEFCVSISTLLNNKKAHRIITNKHPTATATSPENVNC